jgi:HlyD family type I secretion membrane fusion protein
MSNDLQKSDAGLPEQPPSKQTLPVKAITAQKMMAVPSVPVIEPLRHDLRRTKWLGIAIIVLFFGIGGGWAATAPLSGAAVANGVVSPEGSRQKVQHLEGGIIREIKVKEGDHVKAGDTLFILEDVRAKSEVGAYLGRLRNYAAEEARLRAERDGAETIDFDDYPSLADTSDPQVRKVLTQERNQFAARKASDSSRVAILEQRVAQIDKQIVGYNRQLTSIRRQTALIREEIKGVKELYEKGYERKPRLLALQRREAELLGTEGDLMSRVARAEETITETNLQIVDVKVRRTEQIDDQLSQTQAKRIEVEERLKDSEDRLLRTTITAPTTGTILDVRFKTPGGVIRAGEQVAEIVPSEDELIIDTQVRPQDIDNVHVGLPATVMFPSLPRRTTPRLHGKVILVSADAFKDEKTGHSFYQAKVRIDRDYLEKEAPHITLQPGMPAEVFITTEARTVLEYLVQPFTMMLARSFREAY